MSELEQIETRIAEIGASAVYQRMLTKDAVIGGPNLTAPERRTKEQMSDARIEKTRLLQEAAILASAAAVPDAGAKRKFPERPAMLSAVAKNPVTIVCRCRAALPLSGASSLAEVVPRGARALTRTAAL